MIALPTLALAVVIETLIAAPAAAATRPAAGVEARCSSAEKLEEARDDFRKGKELFTGQRWLAAEIHFLRALACSGSIKKVRPYGRWRDSFDPEVYLGLTLHRVGCCLAPGGRRCPLAREWHDTWDDFLRRGLSNQSDVRDDWALAKVDFPGQQRCGTKIHRLTSDGGPIGSENVCGPQECRPVLGSKVTYCPVIDWWAKLVAGGIAPATVASTTCEDTATLAERLSTALSFGGDPADGTNRHVCEAMVRELASVDRGCGGQ